MTFFEICRKAARDALKEDLGPHPETGDITSQCLIGEETGSGIIVANEPCVVAGLPMVEAVFKELDKNIFLEFEVEDGSMVRAGQVVVTISGGLKEILTGERTSLNFLALLSGVATRTRKFVDAVNGKEPKIYDTRKTTPGLRALEKYAVKLGGGFNHRLGLFESFLIKDNHLVNLDLTAAVKAAKVARSGPVEVEVETLDQLEQAIEAGADIVLLDNMGIEKMEEAISLAKSKLEIEVSGGINEENIVAIAEVGPDRISIGALTQQAEAIDFSMTVAGPENN